MQAPVRLWLLCQWANAGGAPPCTLPDAPVDIGATAGNNQVTLLWTVAMGSTATGFNIKRSLVPGGPYITIGTSVAQNYHDLTAVNGTTYYYVVSSTNACGESAGNSLESHATPVSTIILPDGSGVFWKVIVSINGDVYLQTVPGPATPDVILADGGGGFWKLTASVAGDRYGVSNAGPATVAPVILDANLVAWTLIVDATGNIGATS
jgi:cellulose 1,4-beta-cellobiosidase